MRREVRQQKFKLWLLTLVLTVVIAWYTLNPVPTIVQPRKRDAEPPDAKRRPVNAITSGDFVKLDAPPTSQPAVGTKRSFEKLTDWPQYLDLD